MFRADPKLARLAAMNWARQARIDPLPDTPSNDLITDRWIVRHTGAVRAIAPVAGGLSGYLLAQTSLHSAARPFASGLSAHANRGDDSVVFILVGVIVGCLIGANHQRRRENALARRWPARLARSTHRPAVFALSPPTLAVLCVVLLIQVLTVVLAWAALPRFYLTWIIASWLAAFAASWAIFSRPMIAVDERTSQLDEWLRRTDVESCYGFALQPSIILALGETIPSAARIAFALSSFVWLIARHHNRIPFVRLSTRRGVA